MNHSPSDRETLSSLPKDTSQLDSFRLTEAVKEESLRLGFDHVGICAAVAPAGLKHFREWLSRGYAGEMHYLADRRDAYAHPSGVLDGVRSLVLLGMNYRTSEPAPLEWAEGRISRYAWGDSDYHDLIHQRLKQLKKFVLTWRPTGQVRGVVDTAPLLERDFARLAGLGWIGKHTLLLNRDAGSWFFLAALLVDFELVYDSPSSVDYCGTCTACLDACPTGAFPEPYVLDARRCISYLTIELRGSIPSDLRSGIGEWLFGCDICQEVCPWNRRAPRADENGFQPGVGRNPVNLAELLSLTEDEFRDRFRHTPLWRSKRGGILRNAAIVLGNQRPLGGEAALGDALADNDAVVRAAAAWALGKYGTDAARQFLEARLTTEDQAAVREEIVAALNVD
ncbi:MAG: tRNA epoxyqueuosine(34) reductase QueG [Planctomycetales bacterium]|nr:tRNA epoxyqueuosine(34) reductase QueG [Planctomycetales bacterium]